MKAFTYSDGAQPLFSHGDLSRALNVTTVSVRQWAERGHITPAFKDCSQTAYLYLPDEIFEFVDTRIEKGSSTIEQKEALEAMLQKHKKKGGEIPK